MTGDPHLRWQVTQAPVQDVHGEAGDGTHAHIKTGFTIGI